MFTALKSLGAVKDYKSYRWFFTSKDILVVGGKSDEQNELALKHFLKPNYTVMHTSKPGSPFMIIQSENPSEEDLEETAVFCACFSKQWKELKSASSKVDIDIFQGNQIYKNKAMKKGTFGINGSKKSMKVKAELVLIFQKGKLKAVPKTTSEEVLAEIKPGKLSKEEAAGKIAKKIKDEHHLPIAKDDIMQAIPSGRLGIK